MKAKALYQTLSSAAPNGTERRIVVSAMERGNLQAAYGASTNILFGRQIVGPAFLVCNTELQYEISFDAGDRVSGLSTELFTGCPL
jgi:hypothetical protein